MIHARGLTKRFGRHRVLDGLDLTVSQGERVAIIGLNGAGKTTLFRCILGLTPFEGELQVGDCQVRHEGRTARTHIGYVPQRAPQFDTTLSEMVEFFCRLRGVPCASVETHLDATGLSLATHGDKPVVALSGGMLQKALLALALGAAVPTLLLDEPTANLDPKARREFIRALQQIPRETTVLLASHQLADIEAVADRIVVLHQGRFAFDGTLADLSARLSDEIALWIKVPEQSRSPVRELLAASRHVRGIVGSNGAIGALVPRNRGVDLLHELRSCGFTVDDFWTEAPALEDLLERLLEPDARPAPDEPAGPEC